jgi:hypothetical protein|tara:strand:+ start:950 stop:1237 length:288 start_codon:yes stop_codon:yes gene_type:complete
MMFISPEQISRINRNLFTMVIMLYIGIATLIEHYLTVWLFPLGTLILGQCIIEGMTYQSVVLGVFMMAFGIAMLQRACKMVQNRHSCCECDSGAT